MNWKNSSNTVDERPAPVNAAPRAARGNGAAAPNMLPTVAAVLLVSMLGAGALHSGTSGFRAVSTEAARRLEVLDHPRPLPSVAVYGAAGLAQQPLTLRHALSTDGRVAIVSFIYTQCNAICSVLGSEFQQMQDALRTRGAQDKVRLVSISFDPRDTPRLLAGYAQRMHAEPHSWQLYGMADARQRKQVLDAFGIVVLPAPLGEFQHNGAFHLIDRNGRLARIIDYSQATLALDTALAMADGRTPTAAAAAPTGGRL